LFFVLRNYLHKPADFIVAAIMGRFFLRCKSVRFLVYFSITWNFDSGSDL
jgi:hypothetical protein